MSNTIISKNTISKVILIISLACLAKGTIISAPENTGLLKKRTLERRDHERLQMLLNTIQAPDEQAARSKIKGIEKLLGMLHADTVIEAYNNVIHIEEEYQTTLEQNRKQYQVTEQQYQHDIQKILDKLGVITLDEALARIDQLEHSYQQILQFANHLEAH